MSGSEFVKRLFSLIFTNFQDEPKDLNWSEDQFRELRIYLQEHPEIEKRYHEIRKNPLYGFVCGL